MSRISEMIEKYSESRTLNTHKSIIFAKNRMVKYIDKGDIFRIPGVNNYAHGCNSLAGRKSRYRRCCRPASTDHSVCFRNFCFTFIAEIKE